jgi:multidrug transporter EmrE-like cation transporter
MDKKSFVFGKENFIILAISILLIVIGFWLMSGAKTTEETGFDYAIFNARRIIIAPIVTMSGFILVVWAILKKPKDKANIEK